MSPHTQLVLAVGFAALIGGLSLAFVGWLLWSLLWDLYDHWMQQRTRARHNRFDGARSTERFAFRDFKGVHR
jgi:hypothetical protein